MDGRKNNGGHSTKGHAGRKPKSVEKALIEKLKPYDDEVLKILIENVKDHEPWAIKMFMDYRYGKPKEQKEITLIEKEPIKVNYAGDNIHFSGPQDFLA